MGEVTGSRRASVRGGRGGAIRLRLNIFELQDIGTTNGYLFAIRKWTRYQTRVCGYSFLSKNFLHAIMFKKW